jgi:Uncharacterized protein family UPF0029
MMDGNLNSFIVSKRPQPEPFATSQEIRDRGSTFVANIYSVTTPDEAKARVEYLKHLVHRSKPASHEIAAWRCMVLKKGQTGLKGPEDFELMQGSKDDGENWAGGKVLKVMQNLAIIDAVVIVSRWYVSSIYQFCFLVLNGNLIGMVEHFSDLLDSRTLKHVLRRSAVNLKGLKSCENASQHYKPLTTF